MSIQRAWQRQITGVLDSAFERNAPVIDGVAAALSAAILAGRQVYAFGAGHSLSLVNEMYRRAGSIKAVRPVWNDALVSRKDEEAAGRLETARGYYAELTADLEWGPGDVCWVISNSGRNALVVETALEARRRGVTVVALTSVAHCRAVAPTPGLPKLPDIADHVLDNAGCLGDAALDVSGLAERMAPTSTIAGAALIHAVWAETAARLLEKGHVPEVWGSANRDAVTTGTGPGRPARSGEPGAPQTPGKPHSPGEPH